MGRGTWEVVASEGGAGPTAGMRRIVFSRTLDPADHPDIEIVADDAAEVVETYPTTGLVLLRCDVA